MNTNGVHFAENPNRGYGDKCRFRSHMLLVTKWIHNGDEAVHCDHHQVDGRAEDNRQDLRYKKRAHRVVSFKKREEKTCIPCSQLQRRLKDVHIV